ncbi:MAG: excinuclease ABC subunit UvrA [Clostridiales bacterium]|jgi:excinuclease ABC subunit A|nr:excinuclease ABC subunit UvrA [Clostridiales bacterium]
MENNIIIKGARENNLKNIDVAIPRNKFVVITGLSGSGKSSLAFDTIYAEGQRRYVESLSSYARQFLGQMQKPDVDSIDGLSPAISIDQKTTSRNPRSTVGTVTEVYDYLRLLFARIGTPHCPNCGKPITQQTVDQIVDSVMENDEGTKFQILSPVIRGRKGQHNNVFDNARRSGFARVRVDGNQYDLTEEIQLDKDKKHYIEFVVDRLVIKENVVKRLADSIETALKYSDGLVIIDFLEKGDKLYSTNYACPDCDINMEEITPRMFSFNSPTGACPTCAGLGFLMQVDEDLLIPDKKRSLNKGGICAYGWGAFEGDNSMAGMYYQGLAKHYNFDVNAPISKLPRDVLDKVLYGTGREKVWFEYHRSNGSGEYQATFEGVVRNLERRYRETNSTWARKEIEQLMTNNPCHECHGRRLNPIALGVTVAGKNIDDITHYSITRALKFFQNLKLTKAQQIIAKQILKEIIERLGFLENVGLSYLTLSRSAGTLSGGEAQRIRLATQIGSYLMGVLYVLDEPSIGLHQRDNAKLIDTLKHLTALGNTLLVVEHDEDTMHAADHIIDIGPKAGVHGGEVVAQGTINDILKNKNSITGQYLSGKKSIPIPKKRRKGNGKTLKIVGAKENNLKNIDVSIPLGTFTCVTGVSGSGKSSLINEILHKKLAAELNGAKTIAGKHKKISGIEHLDKVIDIDQSPIGRTPRSNPATYTGLFTDIRDIFASTAEAKARGYGSARFSFNVKGGRCEACSGDGIIKIEMHFLPDVFVPCEVCHGKRYNRETLDIHYKGKNIYQVLNMTVDEGVEFFANLPRLHRKLSILQEVGLGYIKIGQSSTTLSGGEAQRVKLATELAKRPTGRTMYILDEPTTGLHAADVHKLIDVLQSLVEAGNSVVVIEHNLDVIKTADYIIDLGPEGGDQGGNIVVSGTPENVAKCSESYTGNYLAKTLKKE